MPNNQPTPHSQILKALKEKSPYTSIALLCLTFMFFLVLMAKLIIEAGYDYLIKNLLPPLFLHPLGWIYDCFFKSATSVDILLGFWGILVGYLIAIILQHTNEEHTEEKHNEVTQVLDKIFKDVGKVVEEAKQLAVITTYKGLLENIEKIIEHAADSDGELLIMNLTASFGYFMTFDGDLIINADSEMSNANSRGTLQECPQREIFRKHKILLGLQTKNDQTLEDCAIGTGRKEGEPPKRVRYVTLRASPNNLTSPFYKKYLEPSLKSSFVQSYAKTSEDVLLNIPNEGKTYLIPDYIVNSTENPQEFAENNTDKDKFVQHLIVDQANKISRLKNANIDVVELDDIPFQLYVSMPDEKQKSGLCLFMFVNQFTLANPHTQLAAFATTDDTILAAFKTIIEAVIAQQESPSREA